MSSLLITQESFPSISDRWGDLLLRSRNNNVFLSPAWQKTWWNTLANGNELMLYGCQRGDELVGIIPLKRKGNQVSFIGSSNLCDYMDFIVDKRFENEVYKAIAHHILGLHWDHLELKGVSGSSLTVSYLVGLLRDENVKVDISPEEVCPTVELPSSWEQYLETLNKKDRHELRRKLRRLYGAGDVRYYVAAYSDRFPSDIDEFISLLELSRTDKAEFMTSDIRVFFQAVISAMGKTGNVRLCFLEFEGKRIAATVSFDYNDTYYLYNSGYDTSYSHLSAGLLLKALCLKEAIERGKKEFNFLRGSEGYKYHLGAIDETVYTVLATH